MVISSISSMVIRMPLSWLRTIDLTRLKVDCLKLGLSLSKAVMWVYLSIHCSLPRHLFKRYGWKSVKYA